MIIGSVSDIASVSGKDTWHVREAAPPLGPAKAGGGGKSKSGGMIVGFNQKGEMGRCSDAQSYQKTTSCKYRKEEEI